MELLEDLVVEESKTVQSKGFNVAVEGIRLIL